MRLVSLTCSNTEIVAALGLADHLVGVDDHSDWPPDALQGVARVGPDLQIDLDRVEALRPDLVLASLTVPGHERVVAGLVARGIPHVAPAPTALEHVARDIREIGALLGAGAVADAVAASFERSLVPVAAPSDPPAVLVEWWPKPVIVPGAKSWVTQLLELAGGRNPFADRPVESLPIADADAIEAAPEAVVISWCGVAEARYRPDRVLGRVGWADVPAIRAGRVRPISEAFLGRPGPRLAHGLAALKDVVADVMRARERSGR